MQQEGSFLDIINQYLASEEMVLPVFDESALRIQQEISKNDPDLNLIERLIGNDPSLTSQVHLLYQQERRMHLHTPHLFSTIHNVHSCCRSPDLI